MINSPLKKKQQQEKQQLNEKKVTIFINFDMFVLAWSGLPGVCCPDTCRVRKPKQPLNRFILLFILTCLASIRCSE